MNAAIVCVGRMRDRGCAAAAEEYEKRISRFGKIEMLEVPDLPEPANASDAQRAQVMDKEGEAILARIRPGDHVTALCVDGPQYDSVAFARKLAARDMLGGRQDRRVPGPQPAGDRPGGRKDLPVQDDLSPSIGPRAAAGADLPRLQDQRGGKIP